jgi:glyoxylase-like metal-dependent hydrolase (beta-lactamase superfamily II)
LKKISNQILSFKLGFTNNFIIKLKKGYLLVDTSYSNKYNQFLNEIKKENIDLNEINYLVLTHHHEDHSGFTNKILSNSKTKLIVHKNAIKLLKKGSHDTTGEHWNWIVDRLLNFFSKIQKHHYPAILTRDTDIIIETNKPIDLQEIGIEGKIIPTPGHSSDSISLILNDGNAIIGDAAMNLLNLGETKYKPFFIQNLDKIYQSWKKLIQHGAKKLHPSHGKSFSITKLINELKIKKE